MGLSTSVTGACSPGPRLSRLVGVEGVPGCPSRPRVTRLPPTKRALTWLLRLSEFLLLSPSSFLISSTAPPLAPPSGEPTQGTSRDWRLPPPTTDPTFARLEPWVGEPTWTGNLVSGPPIDLSLLCLKLAAGEVARGDRLPCAADFSISNRFLSSIFTLLLLSSLLVALGLLFCAPSRFPDSELECWRVASRLSSLKMTSLCSNRSRRRRYACFSSKVRAVCCLGLSMQGARAFASLWM